MSNYQIYDGTYLFFITLSLNKHAPLFSQAVYRNIIIQSLNYSISKKSLRLFAYVIMPTHLHLIVFDSQFENDRLRKTIGEFRKYTAHEIMKVLKTANPELLAEKFTEQSRSDRLHKIWKIGIHPIGLESDTFLTQKMSYIHENPVKAGLVKDAILWEYSSAKCWETGEKGILPISHYLDAESG
jgi:REP element-mobilizing transposase RayT